VVVRVEFNQGVPSGCIEWLWENVGPGNVDPDKPNINKDKKETDAWFYERIKVYPKPNDMFHPRDFNGKYVPTITIKDPKLASWFMLRWS
jgi:hypothetical protein